jgi:hypothetical protein
VRGFPVARLAALPAVLALGLLLTHAPARADLTPSLDMDLGRDVEPAAWVERSYRDTVGVRIFVVRDSIPRLEGIEFAVGYDCSADSACHITRAVRVLSFQADTNWIGSVEKVTCDQSCVCDSCQLPSHYRLHFRTDRISTLGLEFRRAVGTLHMETTRPMRATRLRFDLAYLWVFGQTPLEIRVVDVGARANTAWFGGVTAAGQTTWGTLRQIYR